MASIWLLGTNELADHKKAFHLITKHYLKYFMVKTPILFNFVMEANSISIEWLEKLGAKFSIAKEYGKFGALFKYFELRGD